MFVQFSSELLKKLNERNSYIFEDRGHGAVFECEDAKEKRIFCSKGGTLRVVLSVIKDSLSIYG